VSVFLSSRHKHNPTTHAPQPLTSPNTLKHPNTKKTAVLLTLLIPLPAILAAIYIIPRMVTRYLLVRSLSSVDLNALDSVVEVRFVVSLSLFLWP
jgi:hypothetical protein